MAQCAESLMVPLPDQQQEPQYSSRENVRLSFVFLSRSKILFYFNLISFIFFFIQSNATIILNVGIIVLGQT